MWFPFAVLASVFWGLTYVFEEKIYKHVSIVSTLAVSFITAGVVFLIAAFLSGVIQKDFHTLTSSRSSLILLGLVTLTTVIAEIGIGLSITNKNASIAGLIEISYPLFIVLFSYLIYKESNLNPGTIVGGVLVFLGVAAIYFFNR